MSTDKHVISLKEVVGGGYSQFWHCKKRYRVVKGSRASKKSTTTALNLIVRMMQYPEANTLVVRKVYNTLRDSCYKQLLWAIHRLGVDSFWQKKESPLQLTYLPTGQVILFRGLDSPLKTTSITAEHGFLCWGWVEEAYEVEESEFNTIDESLRGIMPPGYFIQWTLTFNPWDASSWLKYRFFDLPRKDTFAITTNYLCNEWLSKADLDMFEEMKERDPERYKVAGLGEWGVAEGQYFKEWRSALHVVEPFKIPQNWLRFRAMDWGQARPYCVLWFAVDYDGNLWCYRELYGYGGKPNVGTGETAEDVGKRIAAVETAAENVSYGVLDNACWARTGVTGPSIAEAINNEINAQHLVTFGKSSKGRAEAGNAIKERLKGYADKQGKQVPGLRVFSTCVHLIRTLPQLAHDKNNPELYDTKGEDHAADALGYGCLSRPWTPPKPQTPLERDRYRHEEPSSAWAI